jgi:hypothetical protein
MVVAALITAGTATATLRPQTTHGAVVVHIRGGESDHDDDDDESDCDESENSDDGESSASSAVLEQVLDVTKTKVLPLVRTASTQAYRILSRFVWSCYKAGQRASRAAMDSDEVDDDEEEEDEFEITMADQALKLATKIAKTIRRMVVAALDFSQDDSVAVNDDDDDDDDDEEVIEEVVVETKVKAKATAKVMKEDEEIVDETKEDVDTADAEASIETETTAITTETLAAATASNDFGTFLAESYNAKDGRTAGDLVVMGGSFKEAMEEARKQARMLLIYIPAEKPKGGRKFFFGGNNKSDDDSASKDQAVIESLLSAKVVKAANKKARKKGLDTGSFAVWGAKAGSSEANSVIKQLKLQPSKGEKRPTLCAIYPSYVSVSF